MNHSAWPYPRMIAHRGAGKLAPENTLGAFKLGYSHGYRMFECDVKLSADGVAYLMHDATVDRTTNNTGDASMLRWAALSQLDAGSWHSAAYAGEPLPTLSHIAAFVRNHDCAINLEIKPILGAEAHTGEVVATLAAALWQGACVQPLISSFSEVALAAAQKAQPQLLRALLVDNIPADWQARLARLDCVALDVNCKHLSDAWIDQIQSSGYRLLCYTCNDPAQAAHFLRRGLDGVITDCVDTIPA